MSTDQKNTLIYDAETPFLGEFIFPETVAILIATNSLDEGFVTLNIDDGQKIRKYIIEAGVSFVLDFVTNSTKDKINLIEKNSKMTITNGGTHPTPGGSTTTLPPPTSGLVVLQWKDRP